MMGSTKRPLAVGFLGAGYIADWHAAALRTVRGVTLAAVCDRDEGRGPSICGTAPSLACVHFAGRNALGRGARLDPRLASRRSACPNRRRDHRRWAGRTARETDGHCSTEECDGLIEHARSAGVKLGVGHNFLFAPIYERLKQDLAAGRLGRPDEVTITWNKGLGQLVSGPFDLWMLREPGNIILEVGSHSVAHMLDLMGPI